MSPDGEMDPLTLTGTGTGVAWGTVPLGSTSGVEPAGTPPGTGQAAWFQVTYRLPRLGPALRSAAQLGNSKNPSRRFQPGGPEYQFWLTAATVSTGPNVAPRSIERRWRI